MAHAFFLEQRTRGQPLDHQRLIRASRAAQALPKVEMRASPSLAGADITPHLAGDISGWTPLGPGNIGGRTRALLIDPVTPSTMYAAGVAGGIWKTTTSGQSWVPLDDRMANLAVVTLAFQRSGVPAVSPTVIYAGTGEGFFNGDAVRGAGIFRSDDAGETWVQLPATANEDFHYVNKIVASPNDPNVVYAATRTGVYRIPASGVPELLIANGAAAPGIEETDVPTQAGFTDIEVAADVSPDLLIASNGIFMSDGVYRSADAGVQWTRVLSPTGIGRSDIAIAPSDASIMYALASDARNNHQLLNVYRSTNAGVSWTPQISGSFDPTSPDWLLLTNPYIANFFGCQGSTGGVLFNQGWYDNAIAVAPHDPNVVFAGGIDLFRSDDGGASWGIISYWWLSKGVPGYAHADQHTFVFDPNFDGNANQTLFIGSDGGVFRSDNALAATADRNLDGICYVSPSGPGDVRWTSLNNGYAVTQFYHGRPIRGLTEGYMAGAQDNGTVFGRDALGPNGWIDVEGGDGGYVGFDPDTGTLFLEFTNKSLSRGTINAPFQFEGITDQLNENTAEFLFIAPFRQDPSNPEHIWYGGRRPWRSRNAVSATSGSQVEWDQLGAPLDAAISAWAIDPSNGNNVWAGTSNGSVYRADVSAADATTQWTNVTPPFSSSAYISWIEIDANDPLGQTVWVTNSLYGSEHVYRTLDAGQNWEDLTGSLPDMPVHTIAIQPGAPQNRYIGTELGVFMSRGEDWMNANDGFTNTVVEALEIVDRLTLYAFTHGRGAFRASIEPPANAPPSLAAIVQPAPIDEDAGPQTIDLSGVTPGVVFESGQRIVSITVRSDNPALIPNPVIAGELGVDPRIEFTPAPDANGTAVLTVTAQDNGGTDNGGQDTATRDLTITVRPIDDPPRTTDDAYTLNEDNRFTSPIGVLFNDRDPDGNETLTATLERDVEAGTLALRNDGVFTFEPPADTSGTFGFSYRVGAGDSSSVGEVTLTVLSVNDAPRADPAPSIAPVLEDAGEQSFQITGIVAGPANESEQVFTTEVDTDTPDRIGGLRVTLTASVADVFFTPRPDAFGTADVIVRVRDNGGIIGGGTDTTEIRVPVSLTAINDPPTINITVPTAPEPGPQTIMLTNLRPGPSNESRQALTVSVGVTPAARLESFLLGPIVNGQAELVLTPAEAGDATLTVRVTDDGGTANGGIATVERSAAVTFALEEEEGGGGGGCACLTSSQTTAGLRAPFAGSSMLLLVLGGLLLRRRSTAS